MYSGTGFLTNSVYQVPTGSRPSQTATSC